MLGTIFCLSLEITQLIVSLLVGLTFRVIDINDVIFNMLGIFAGYLLYQALILEFFVTKLTIQSNALIRFMLQTMQTEKEAFLK